MALTPQRRRQFKCSLWGWSLGQRHSILPGVNILLGGVLGGIGFIVDVFIRGCFDAIPEDILNHEKLKKFPPRIKVLEARLAKETCPRRRAKLQRDIDRLTRAVNVAKNTPGRWDR